MVVMWMACDCHVWPLTALYNPGRCGECRKTPHAWCDAPVDGKAHRISRSDDGTSATDWGHC